MELFTEVFWFALVLGGFGGFLNALIRTINDWEDQEASEAQDEQPPFWILAVLKFIRDLFAGIGAAFAFFMLTEATNDTAGLYFGAFIAGLAGVAALDQFRQAQGYRALLGEALDAYVKDSHIIPKLKAENKRLRQENELLRQRLGDALSDDQYGIDDDDEQRQNSVSS